MAILPLLGDIELEHGAFLMKLMMKKGLYFCLRRLTEV